MPRYKVLSQPGAAAYRVVDAVACAMEIQRERAKKNAQLPTNRAIHFRIGIDLGDVMVQGEEIYGDGVNIAARLESLAEPGGICTEVYSAWIAGESDQANQPRAASNRRSRRTQ